MNKSTMQDQFEEWMRSLDVGFDLEFFSEYTDGRVQGYWETWQASRSYFNDIVIKPILNEIVSTGVKKIIFQTELLAAAERYLEFRHHSDIGFGTEYSGVHPQTELKNAIAKAKGELT